MVAENAEKNEIRQYLPFAIDVSGMECLIAGGGKIALRKARSLAEGGARITVVSPEFAVGFSELEASGAVRLLRERFTDEHIAGRSIVIAATNDAALNAYIGELAAQSGCLYCVASSAKRSNLIFPARYRKNGISVAVHSNGTDCLKSRYTKNRIAEFLSGTDSHEFVIAGFYRESLPQESARALDEFVKSSSEPNGETMFVSTCRRWELYIFSERANDLLRSLFERVHRETGVDISLMSGKMYQKRGSAAFHHFLRVATSLDSFLFGETDITAQLNSALKHWARPQSPIADVISCGLLKARRIRERHLSALPVASWQDAVLSFLATRADSEKTAVRLVGEGAFVERIRAAISGKYPLDTADEQIVLNLEGSGGENGFGLREIAESRITVPQSLARANAALECMEQSLRWNGSFFATAAPGATRIGLRSSELSRAQLKEIGSLLKVLSPDFKYEPVFMSSPGDRDKKTPLPLVRREDFFTRDLDKALLSHKIDLAVHSAKDLPEKLPEGLAIAARTPSLVQWDCLVSREGISLAELPEGARVGTSSKRRADCLRKLRPDIRVQEVRGDVPARIAQLDGGAYDALVLAAVGLIRLGLQDRISEIFSQDVMETTSGQGSLALVIRSTDSRLRDFLQPLDMG
ncbi:MAG: hydroxymethylbilane synthase [Phycisphaerae bacterium]|jgi:hydroxymethylbilane synthase